MEEKLKVSVLVPLYNAEKYIEACARSLFRQSYPHLELIFCDDCSTDGSVELLKRVITDYPNRISQVVILQNEQNQGVAAVRETLLHAASSSFITYVDADDFVADDFVRLLVEKQQESDADIVSCDVILHEADKDTPLLERDVETREEAVLWLLKPNESRKALFGRLIRKDLFLKNGISFTKGINIGEDWQAMVKLTYYAHTVGVLHQLLYTYNMTNTNSLTHNSKRFSRPKVTQEIASCESLVEFFKDKENIFYSTVKDTEAILVAYLKGMSLKSGNKAAFDYCAEKFLTLDRKYHGSGFLQVNPITTYIRSNYYLLYLYGWVKSFFK